jgi:hypothetical protein
MALPVEWAIAFLKTPIIKPRQYKTLAFIYSADTLLMTEKYKNKIIFIKNTVESIEKYKYSSRYYYSRR